MAHIRSAARGKARQRNENEVYPDSQYCRHARGPGHGTMVRGNTLRDDTRKNPGGERHRDFHRGVHKDEK